MMNHMILAPDEPALLYSSLDVAHSMLFIGLMLLMTGLCLIILDMLYLIIIDIVDAVDSTYSLFMLVDDSDDGIDFMPAMMRHHSIR